MTAGSGDHSRAATAFLLDSGEPAVRFLTRRDLLDEESHDDGRLLTTTPKGLGPAGLVGAGVVCRKLPPCAPCPGRDHRPRGETMSLSS